jgi:hypothetical protein
MVENLKKTQGHAWYLIVLLTLKRGRVMDAVSIDKRTTHHIKKAKHKLNNVDLPRTSARCMNACENHVCEL